MFLFRRPLWIPLIFALAAAPAFSQPQGQAFPASFADLVAKLSPAVVNISTTQKVTQAQGMLGMPFPELPNSPQFEPFRDFFERFGQMQKLPDIEREVFSLGSGFIIDASGYVITNNHVIEGAEEITVNLSDNSKYIAEIVGRDPKTDLALLKLEPKKDLPYVPLGDSDAMRVGDWVIAIGNPFGLGGTVTHGIISAEQRSINAGPFDDFIQTDAPINRGNSGGPLFNLNGEVIGINTAIFSTTGGSIGISFAIPTALAKPVIEQLKAHGVVHRGWLGVKIQVVSDEVAESLALKKSIGALVLEVTPGGPAEKVGLQSGDIITGFNGKEIREMRLLPRLVAETKAGETVTLTYWRAGKFATAKVKIAALEDEENAAPKPKGKPSKETTPALESVLGMDVAPLTKPLRDQMDLDDKATGVAVVDVERGSQAARQGVQPGDVIESVNNEKVNTPAELKKELDKVRALGRAHALLKILRGKDNAFITLPLGK